MTMPDPIRYPDTRTFGQQIGVPPGLCKDALTYAFAVRSNSTRVAALAKWFLSDPTGGEVTYEPLGDIALVSYLDAQLISHGATLGWVHDLEAAMWVPLIERRGFDVRPVFWMPYVVVNTACAMASGRDVWGFRKTVGEVEVPLDPTSAQAFVASALLFDTLGPDSQGTLKPFLTVRRSGRTPNTPAPALASGRGGFLAWLVELLRSSVTDAEILAHLVDDAFHRSVPIVNLRAFPKVGAPTECEICSLTDAPLAVEKIHDFGLLDAAEWELEVARAESCDVESQVGIPTGRPVEVLAASWVKMDFSIPMGSVIWNP